MMNNLSQNQQFQTPDPNLAALPPPERDSVVKFDALFSTIWRGSWVIALVTMLAVLAGGYYAFEVATPLYRSTSVVILETKQDSIVDLQSVVGGLTGETSEVNSELEVLRSRGLMGNVVDQLDLTKDPEFNSALRPRSLINALKIQIKTRLGLLGQQGTLTPAQKARRIRDQVITDLLDKVTVRNVPLSLVFKVTAQTENPEKSARIADTIVQRYIRNQLEVKFEATEQATIWLTNRVAQLQYQLETATSATADFNASTELVSVQSLKEQEVLLKEMRERIRNSRNTQEVAMARLETLKSAGTRTDQARLAEDPQLTRLSERLQAAVENNDQIASAFDRRFAQILARADLDLNRTGLQLTALTNSEIEIRKRISVQSQDLIELQQLTREAEAIRLLYEHFLTRLKETSAQQGIQQPDSRILSQAVVVNIPASPRKTLLLAMSGILGMMIGLALVLLREARSSGFRTARELEAHTGQTVLGQIPKIPARRRRRLLQYLSNKPNSALAESVRNLRTSVLLTNADKPPGLIMSTSSIPGEGKTTNSLALAHNLGGLGKSVLLIEGDIRRRIFSQYFDNLPEKGLVSVLSGEQTLQQAASRSDVLGADILVGERSDINAADLFASEKFRAMIDHARAQYEVVIIDTPPVLVVPDARIITQVADVVLFSVHWDKTSRQQVDEALRVFRTSNLPVTGLVLSQINTKAMKQYGYGGHQGAYTGYGAKYYSN